MSIPTVATSASLVFSGLSNQAKPLAQLKATAGALVPPDDFFIRSASF
jgi:hypothetical protein